MPVESVMSGNLKGTRASATLGEAGLIRPRRDLCGRRSCMRSDAPFGGSKASSFQRPIASIGPIGPKRSADSEWLSRNDRCPWRRVLPDGGVLPRVAPMRGLAEQCARPAMGLRGSIRGPGTSAMEGNRTGELNVRQCGGKA
jgi:hypothetical protein